MNLALAKSIAERLLTEMRPYCERVEIAGSIRRGKLDVKDIEIVAIPRWENHQDIDSLFGESKPVNHLHRWAQETTLLQWIKPGVGEIVPWQVKPEGKYWRGLVNGTGELKIKLDLFLTTPESWGVIYLIRTGSAEFSEAVVTQARRIGKRCINGGLQTDDGESIATPEESDVFDALNLAYVEPAQRIGRDSLRSRKIAVATTSAHVEGL